MRPSNRRRETAGGGTGMILVTTHRESDFDGAAGMLGVLLLYPGAVASFPGSIQAPLRRYLDAEPDVLPTVKPKEVDLESVETLVLVDTSDADRIGVFAPLIRPGSGTRVVVFDHHPEDERPPGDAEWHRESVGAVTTMLIDLLRDRGIVPSPQQATLLALGIYEDTGCLLFGGTTARDLRAVAWLVECGADLDRVSRTLSRGLSAEQVELYHQLLHEAEIVRMRGREVELACLAPDEFVFDASVVVQQYAQAGGALRLVTLLRMDDRVFLIVRSRAADFDASRLARAFGGGGHRHAASATLHNRTLIEARQQVIEALEQIVEPPARAGDLSTPILHWLPADSTVSDGVERLNRYRVNGLPVRDAGGKVLGLLTRQAADMALHHRLGRTPVRDLVSEEVPWLPPDAPLDEVEARLLRGTSRLLLVGPTAEAARGVITRTALLQYLAEGARVGTARSRQTAGEHDPVQDVSGLARRRLPEDARAILEEAGRIGREMKAAAYLVGGVVRDLLLGRPNRDLDVVVEGDACELAGRLAEGLGGEVRLHPAFQTAAIRWRDDLRLDLATARTEHYPEAGDLPSVEPSSLRQDLFRRDFTINALALSLDPDGFGRLLDPFGGRKDLAQGKIRVLHGLSIIEDPTRAYRAVRFALRLGFEISGETARLVRAARSEGVFERLSGARLRRELEQIFDEGRLVAGVRKLEEFDLLTVVHPELRTTRKLLERLERLDETLAWYQLQPDTPPVARWTLAIGLLSERIAGQERTELWRRLAPKRRDRRVLDEIPHAVHRLVYELASGGSPPPSRVYRACESLSPEGLLLATVFTRRSRVRDLVLRFLSTLRHARLAIRGSDLLESGVPEGPAVSGGLRAALDAVLDRPELDRDAQLRIALAAARDA